MSRKFPPKIVKIAKKQIARRDINHYHNHSDPIPILLIFCLFIFLVFAFVLALLVLSGKWRNSQENNTGNEQSFNIFVEPIEFFEARHTIFVSSADRSLFSFPHRQDFSFNFQDFQIVPQTHLVEIAEMHAKVEKGNDKSNYFLARNRRDRIDRLEGLTVNFPDFTIVANRPAHPNASGDRATDLRAFFPVSRDFDGIDLFLNRDRVLTSIDPAKNPTIKRLDRNDLVEFQPQLNTDEFSARIAIANRQAPTFLPSPDKSSKPIPESTNGWSAIVIFLFAICCLSRQKK
ncbi:MAG: hypothetical protein J7647_20690 [Cyanobacteria bacterium SBLK]|nr:hypothetical protein [Cyanobacteria bacterium SBLK]